MARRGTELEQDSRDPVAVAFGSVLRERRLELSMTQEAVAEAADLHWKYIGMLERGLNQPTIGSLMRLARALSTTGSELLTRVEEAVEF